MLPQQTFLQQRQQQPPELLQRHQPIAQEKYQKHRHSSLPYVNLEDSRNNRQYPQVQEYKVKPLEVVAATRPNNRIGGPGGKVNSSMGGVAGAGVVTGTDVQSKSSSSSSGHTMVRTARADFSDGPQNVSNRHVNSRSIQHDNSNRYSVTNGSSNYDSVTINQGSGSNQSDGNDVQILGSKLPFKRGNVEISEGAGMQSNSYKPTSAERNKRPKVNAIYWPPCNCHHNFIACAAFSLSLDERFQVEASSES